MANGDEISSDMNHDRVRRVRKFVEDGNYEECSIKGRQEIDMFVVDGMAAILRQARKGNIYAVLSGVGTSGVIYLIIEIVKALHPHLQTAQLFSGY
jgi:cysteine synthase